VWTEVITDRPYYGDVIQNSRGIREGDQANPDITVGHSISIVADAFASERIYAIRYVEWGGVRWAVSNVDAQPPRLILRLGEVYRGPKVAAA